MSHSELLKSDFWIKSAIHVNINKDINMSSNIYHQMYLIIFLYTFIWLFYVFLFQSKGLFQTRLFWARLVLTSLPEEDLVSPRWAAIGPPHARAQEGKLPHKTLSFPPSAGERSGLCVHPTLQSLPLSSYSSWAILPSFILINSYIMSAVGLSGVLYACIT